MINFENYKKKLRLAVETGNGARCVSGFSTHRPRPRFEVICGEKFVRR